jgi:hypothetical protein
MRIDWRMAGAVAVALAMGGPAVARAQFFYGPPEHGPEHGGGPGMDFLGVREVFEGKVVKGAPYKAEAVTEVTQTLADGNKIARKTTSTVWRDSSGRTRREVTLAAVGPMVGKDMPRHVFIHDPVAGTTYVLEPDRKIARKMPAFGHGLREGHERPEGEERPGPGARFFNRRVKGPGPDGAGENRQTESLGAQTVDGLEATGTRTTITIPAGSIGNERPIEVVSERWYSPELQVVVSSSHRDPRFGDNSYRLTGLQRVEPDKSLFEVPADYTVKEGPPEGMGNVMFKRMMAPKDEQ